MTDDQNPMEPSTDEDPAGTRSNPERTVLGVVAVAAIGAGLWGMVTAEDPGWPGITLRSGIILAAIWLALPNLRRLRSGTWLALAAPVLVLLIRPRLILWGLGAGAMIWIANRRLGRPLSKGTARETGQTPARKGMAGRGKRRRDGRPGSRSNRPEERP